METSDLALSQLTEIITKVTTIITKGLTDTISADERATSLAPELEMILENAIGIANSSHMGKYIFSGLPDLYKTV